MPERGSDFNHEELSFPFISPEFAMDVIGSLSAIKLSKKKPVRYLALRDAFSANSNRWISLTELAEDFESTQDARKAASTAVSNLDDELRKAKKPLEVITLAMSDREGTETYYRLRKLE